jgi:fluoroacetyl-CoA thioesterase
MKDSLKPGLIFEFTYKVPENKTVPYLYSEATELQNMPKVLATGFMVGLIEWTCIQAINPHLDWPKEQTVGIGFTFNHSAATPPGMMVTVKVTLDRVEGRKLTLSFVAHDEVDKISEGAHDRFVINAEKFNAQVAAKAATIK